VIRTGEAELTPRITDDMLVAATRDAAQLAALRELGLRSAITAPLVARGRTLGAIRLVTAESRRIYEPRDLELAKELGRRAGLAVDNARLYQQAQHAVRVREDTLAIVSHDLRNPLGAIDLSASLLLQTQGEDPRTRKQLEIIRRAAERMERLIRDLLDMASIQAGRLALERKPENAKQLVAEVADSFEPLATEKGLVLVRDDHLAAVTILCDRTRITQVIGNLLSNALKFCSAGDTITVGGRAVGDEARIEIADTGPGIAAADLPHIFEPYWSARRHAKKGTGLGLYICRGIVEAHGGRLWVETSEGHGTAFFVSLPLVR
jgi:signal transduction histidine kinase